MSFHLAAILSDIVVGAPPTSDARSIYSDPALAFVLTGLIEWPLLAWWSGLGWRRTGLFCLLMNGMTWGAAMGVLAVWNVSVPVMEGAIIVVEAGLMMAAWRWKWWRALPISSGINLASWWLGVRVLSFLIRHR
jgi:hypothetical protein